ncbi:hypothetical protein LX73_0163 [Fodinibius salinus]|uniref:Uncharacterized protein n=1 Tax=Fodinibius salinus TaxID=860790 RepID=A0A5D3YPB0_9BACT|nr:hypothetical protein [Fodinibius salinus]TYP94873.1 hypothetical protein LX73_0163 [Fodinibius salinus]
MDPEDFQKLFELAKKRREDPDYIYEHGPAFNFLDFISEKKERDDIELHRNEDDPPDYFIKIDEDTICLEITTLVFDEIIKRNSFLKTIKESIDKVFFELREELPNKRVVFYLFPGNEFADLGSSEITIPDFSTRASQSKIYDHVKQTIQEQIDDFLTGDTESLFIRNEDDEIFAKLNSLGLQDSEQFEWFINPNRIYKSDDWKIDKLEERINSKISSKSKKYSSEELKKNDWWLLLCDPQREMNLEKYIEGIEQIKFDIGNFANVYLSIDNGASFKCIELAN